MVARQLFDEQRNAISALAERIADCLRGGHTLLVCGNGGSAADAQHFTGELVNRFLKEREPYAAIALTTDTSVLTAIGNDCSYDRIFEKQVQALGKPGDMLIAISTSGNTQNVIRAVEAAKRMGLITVGLTGGGGGQLAETANDGICISSTTSTPRIQEGHGLIIHLLCEQIEELLESR